MCRSGSVTRVAELTIEHLAIENEELRERIRDLESDKQGATDTLRACLDLCRQQHLENVGFRRQLERQRDDGSKPAVHSALPRSQVKASFDLAERVRGTSGKRYPAARRASSARAQASWSH